MKKILPLLFVLIITLAASCDKYDSWTTSPTAQLTFSTFTVSFDTVFTNISSPTKQLLVWNHNDAGLRIRQVFLSGGKKSHFRVNVDGQYLYNGVGEDFEIRRKDSIFVKVEVTLPEGIDSMENHYEDELIFALESGVMQRVKLVADGIDVTILRAITLDQNTTLKADKPYLIYDSLVVEEGVKLTIEPGTRLMFHDNVNLIVRGTLSAVGTLEQPIIFRGDRLDNLFDYLPYDNTPNRWGGIRFSATSRDNEMYQCDVHSASYGIDCIGDGLPNAEEVTPMLKLTNSVIHNIGGHGLRIYNSAVQVIGTQISNTQGYTVYQFGGYSLFVHCTIAQYYAFTATRGAALYLTNYRDNEELQLYGAYFLNCAITGYDEDVIIGTMAENDGVKQPYLFRNCLLRTIVTEDEDRFQLNIFDNDDITPNGTENFKLVESRFFRYSFVPSETSTLRHHADPDIAIQFSPMDRLGHSRLEEDGTDIGAYQYFTRDDTARHGE